jgi:hypothetical protein
VTAVDHARWLVTEFTRFVATEGRNIVADENAVPSAEFGACANKLVRIVLNNRGEVPDAWHALAEDASENLGRRSTVKRAALLAAQIMVDTMDDGPVKP